MRLIGRLALVALVLASSVAGAQTTTVPRIGYLANGSAGEEHVGAVQILPSPMFFSQRRALIQLAAKYRLPAVYEFRDYVDDGGLMSYGPNTEEMFRGLAGYVDRILKGAKPADLPIERPA
jgi:ABC-type uncharacterized transport system substrate-binding protein